jgi:hypothetical protein
MLVTISTLDEALYLWEVANVFVGAQKMGNLGWIWDLIRYLSGMLEQAGDQGHRTGYPWGIDSGKALAHAAFWVTSLE